MLKTLPILLGVLLLAAGPVQAAGPLTTRQADALPADGVKDTLLGQLGGEMELVKPACGGPNRCDLSDYKLRTKPYSTNLPDLCRSDILTIDFEAVGKADRYEDQPMRPRGFASYSTFFFLKDPTGQAFWVVRPPSAEATAECRQPLGSPPVVFQAESEEEAYSGYQAFIQLLDPAKAGPGFDCAAAKAAGGQKACRDILKSIRRSDLMAILPCAGATLPPTCADILAGGHKLEVHWRDAEVGVEVVKVAIDPVGTPAD